MYTTIRACVHVHERRRVLATLQWELMRRNARKSRLESYIIHVQQNIIKQLTTPKFLLTQGELFSMAEWNVKSHNQNVVSERSHGTRMHLREHARDVEGRR